MTDRPTVVWTEIPVTDLDAATKFYRVFGWTMSREDGPKPIRQILSAILSGVCRYTLPRQTRQRQRADDPSSIA
jgi:hypothetical protein